MKIDDLVGERLPIGILQSTIVNFLCALCVLCGEEDYSAEAGATFQPLTSTTGLAPPRSLER